MPNPTTALVKLAAVDQALDTAKNAGETAGWLVSIGKKIATVGKLWGRIQKRFKRGKFRIVIFGASGTGKTTLARKLAGGDQHILGQTYHESFSTEESEIETAPASHVLTLPGQQHRMPDAIRRIRADISDGRIHGAIHVVSLGFHSFRPDDVAYTRHPLFRDGMSPDDFLTAYRTEMLKRELRALEGMAACIRDSRNHKFWLVTLVTKQDLWFDEQDSKSYDTDQYNMIINTIKQSRSGFRHELFSGSLGCHNFKDSRGNSLKSIVAGYDNETQRLSLQSFLQQLASWSEERRQIL